jgi:hypothetical protein
MSLSALSAISNVASSMTLLNPASASTTKYNLMKQPFADISKQEMKSSTMTAPQIIVFVFVFLLSLWLLMFIGAYVFNQSIPKIFPMIKKISILEFFGLYLTTHILFT